MYADNIKLCITCDGDLVPTGTISECVGEIRHWIRTNMLGLNDSKTEMIHLSAKFYGHDLVPPCDLHFGGVSISSYNTVCIFGVIMDSAWTM